MLKSPKILVVDDEEIMRSGCERVIEDMGMEVCSAENGRIGLNLIKEREFDLVLVDLLMPEMGGMELLDAIRSYDENIISIVITGYATIETAVEAVKKGAFDYLPKPFTPDAFRTIINRGLKHRHLLLEAEELRREREKNLLEIASERSRTATIIQCMGEGLLVTNRRAQLVLINPMAQRMLEINEAKIVGKRYHGQLNNKTLEELIGSACANGRPTANILRKEIPCETESEKYFLAVLAPIVDDTEGCAGTVIVLSDISNEKRIDKMKSDFVRLVAHELKAPIGAIEGYLDLILDGMIDEDALKQREIITRCRDRAASLLTLIKDLLNLSAIEAGKVTQRMERVQIPSILHEVIGLLGNEAAQRNITLSLGASDAVPSIIGDSEDLIYLFTNLVNNAIKYNKQNGEVRVSLSKNGSYVIVTVEDTGIGISAHDQKAIFDQFYRVKNEKTRNIVGTGLGLSIAKKIAESHRGYIKVKSVLGQGSTFTVFLPFAAEENRS